MKPVQLALPQGVNLPVRASYTHTHSVFNSPAQIFLLAFFANFTLHLLPECPYLINSLVLQ